MTEIREEAVFFGYSFSDIQINLFFLIFLPLPQNQWVRLVVK